MFSRPLVFATIPKLRLRLITIDPEPDKYCDVQGNKIYGSVTLQPFESKILISSDFETPDLLIEAELIKNFKVR